jgi:hypothetical protein
MQLEQLAQQLIQASAAAKTLRNKSAPIYKLPPELLARIFYFYVVDAYDAGDISKVPVPSGRPSSPMPMGFQAGLGVPMTPPGQPGAFTPTTPPPLSPLRTPSYDFRYPNRYLQVTRYFRDTVISSPHLWTRIRGGIDTRYIDLSIERSGSAPLDIDLGVMTENCGPYYSPFSPHIFQSTALTGLHNFHHLEKLMSPETCARIRSLVLDNARNRWSVSSHVLSLFAHPAPQLESLVISFAHAFGEGALPQLFANDTPSLRKLTISFYTTWPGNSFTGLTHLTLLRQDVHSEVSPTLQQMLNFLRESPALEELIMYNWGCAPIAVEDEIDSMAVYYPLVQLKSLRLLSIGLWPSFLASKQFMNHLVTPESTVAYSGSYGIPAPSNGMVDDENLVEIRLPLRHKMPIVPRPSEEERQGKNDERGREGDTGTIVGEEPLGINDEDGQEEEGTENNDDEERPQIIHSGELGEEYLFEEVRLLQAQDSSPTYASYTITNGNKLQYCLVCNAHPLHFTPYLLHFTHFTHLRTLWICREFGSHYRLSHWRTLYSSIPQLEKLVIWGTSSASTLSPVSLLSGNGELPCLDHIEVHFATDPNDLVLSLMLCAQNRIQAAKKLSTVVVVSLARIFTSEEQLHTELETQVSKLVGRLEYRVEDSREEPFIAPMPPPGDESQFYFSPL